jgi:hypothetical protein
MLNRLDDYPVHQTPEPLAVLATSDRNAYDRTWFNGYAPDGSYYFGVGMAVYPHRGILDCAFSTVRPGQRQYCFYASRRAPTERTELTVGPMRQTLWQNGRRIMDATRFDQFGRWSGVVRTPDGEFRVDESVCRGTKDRSWGVRRVGEPEPGGAPALPGGIMFLWAPLVWDDHITHAIFFDGAEGQALVREGLTAPLYARENDIPGTEDGRCQRLATARHRVEYHPGTRLARHAEIDLVGHDGAVRTIALDPILRFQMKGLGYGHPSWGQGMWKGELAIGGESFDVAALDPLAPENLHVQQVVRASEGVRTGVGVLEQVVFGPYAPAGFAAFLDGARG